MKTLILKIIFAGMIICFSQSCESQLEREYTQAFDIKLSNGTDLSRADEVITLSVAEIKALHPDFNPQAFIVIDRSKELASQAIDLNADGDPEQILFITDFAPQESKNCQIRYALEGEKKRTYTKRTQAELSIKTGGKFVEHKYEGGTFTNISQLDVPPEHTDHSLFIRYEGPGWESDKVGYRFYLDWRNATDIFGKKVTSMVLQDVGQDGFDSYHEMSSWGQDILKVGESLGIGSIAIWTGDKAERVAVTDSVKCRIVSNGDIQSYISTDYFGWQVADGKYDLTSDLSIDAGSRLTKNELLISDNPDNLCTGIVKHDSAEVINSANDADWQYLATYGRQSLADDMLGMAVLYKKHDFLESSEDQYSHVVVLKPDAGKLVYYFLAAWEKEPGGITSKDDFETYLGQTVKRLSNPIQLSWD